ncbi:hypothetical protein J5J86_13840 [Aquabacter sp. L1I39]|uniref:hypothetical protein n=1 Tax=Aquabacter sp. L1I39 TaxID=2820278 RepID=UPI001AD9F787|nr:hypothetical protein [Aquabacter sp. L1I39]QTL01887.1 hypothetical protein J5J86_13840 [Aquabacter sp. L1I39]
MTDAPKTLADYPYVVVRIECGLCGRRGRYRLARLAERFGADTSLEDLLDQIAGRRCRYPRPWRVRRVPKLMAVCHIHLPDLVISPPPDMPPEPGVKLVVDNSGPPPSQAAAE